MQPWEDTVISHATLGDYVNAQMMVSGWGRERIFISQFFGDQPYIAVEEHSATYQHNLAQYVMKDFFEKTKGLKRVLECNPDDGDRQTAAVYEEIEFDYKKTFRGFSDAAIGFEDEDGDKILVMVSRHDANDIHYRVMAPEKHANLLKEWFTLARSQNFYKGKKINATCGFLELQNHNWDDVILPANIISLLKNMVQGAIAREPIYRKNKLSLKRGIMLSGKPGNGKMASLSSTVWTPSGPCQMGDLKLGDLVCTPDGSTAPITGIFPQGEQDNYQITFMDGDTVECGHEHLWSVSLKGTQSRKEKVMSLREIIDYGIQQKDGSRRFHIRMPEPLNFEARDVEMEPYMMGVLLGDGGMSAKSISLTSDDEQIISSVRELVGAGYEVKATGDRGLDFRVVRTDQANGMPGVPSNDRNIHINALRRYGLWGKTSLAKFIPADYKYNTVEVRLALLQGLMDTDGTVDASSGSGTPIFNTSSEQLAQDVKELVETLGGIATIKPKKTKYTYKGERRECAQAYRVFIRVIDPRQLFRLNRKIAGTFERTKYKPIRVIDKIEKIGREEMQCIMVDHPDHLYMTDHCVVTHNTSAIKVIAKEVPDSVTVIYAQPSNLVYAKDVRGVCSMARDLAPCVLIIEDIDWIAEDRDTGDAGRVIELMNQLDGIEEFSNVITIATTNDVDKIEKAIKNRPGRFDRIINIDNPDEDCRRRMLALFTKHWTISKDVDRERIVSFSDGLSGAHMHDLCVTMAMKAIEDDSLDEDEIVVVKADHFEQAIKEVKDKDFSTYMKQKSTTKKKGIGFHASPFDDDDD